MTIAAKLFLSLAVLVAVVVFAAWAEPRDQYPDSVRVTLGSLILVGAIGLPASAIAWIWGW